MEEPRQRLAPGPHPLLPLRPGLHPAPGHPDVLPGRPAVRSGPHLQLGPRPAARQRLIARFDLSATRPEWALAFDFDIVLRGPEASVFEETRTTMTTPEPLGLTPSQTVGPVPAHRPHLGGAGLVVPAGHPGRRAHRRHPVRRHGRGRPRRPGRDLAGRPGRPVRPLRRPARGLRGGRRGFSGFARASTVDGGAFEIVTVKPGRLPFGDGRRQAPHLDVSVFARGMLDRTVTRIYFPDEAEANAADPVLSAVDPERRHTLVAVAEPDGTGSTSTSRASMRPSSSPSERPYGGLLGHLPGDPSLDGPSATARLVAAMLRAEGALATAQAEVGPGARRRGRRGRRGSPTQAASTSTSSVPRRPPRATPCVPLVAGSPATSRSGRGRGRLGARRRHQPGHPRHGR